MNVLCICPPHLSDVATLLRETQKGIFDSVVHRPTHFRLCKLLYLRCAQLERKLQRSKITIANA